MISITKISLEHLMGLKLILQSGSYFFNSPFFEIFIQRSKASFKLGMQPEYTRIGILMLADNSEFITKLLATTYECLKKTLEHDKERCLIKPETDADLVVNMLYAFTIQEYFRNGLDENLLLKKLDDAVKIIKDGISIPKN